MASQAGPRGRRSRNAGSGGTTTVDLTAGTPAAGDIIDGRYRLQRALPDLGGQPSAGGIGGGLTTLRWAGVDELLDRPVEIRVYSDDGADGLDLPPLLTRLAGQDDARWLRLLDAGRADGGGWLVIEDPTRPSLAQRLQVGPLDDDEAVSMALAVTAAVANLHSPVNLDRALRPDHVYLDGDGVRIDGVDALADVDASRATPVPDRGPAAVVAIGRLLFAALTARWPGTSDAGTPPAAGSVGSPRRIRGGIARPLDRITAAALAGRILDLSALEVGLGEARRRTAPDRGPSAAFLTGRKIAARVLPPLALALIGLVSWIVGSDLGAVPAPDRIPAAPPTHAAATSGGLVWQTPPRVTSFDPQGDGTEDPSGASAAVDASRITAWTTDTYRTAAFGGLKQGVGLLVDLGAKRSVATAALRLTAGGGALQLRAGNSPPSQAADLPLVGQVAPSGRSARITLKAPVTARYWLVWFTKLPASGNGYRDGIASLRLLAPTSTSGTPKGAPGQDGRS